MPLSGPLKPWTFYRSPNFPFIEKVGNKNVLIVCVDQMGAYGFLMNTDKTGQQMQGGGNVKFSRHVTWQARKNPTFLKCQALLTKSIQPELMRDSFIACDYLYDHPIPLKPRMFDKELFPATERTIQTVIQAVRDCPTLSKVEKQEILTFAISVGYTKKR